MIFKKNIQNDKFIKNIIENITCRERSWMLITRLYTEWEMLRTEEIRLITTKNQNMTSCV